MMKDTPQGQTNHCPMCEDAAKRIDELERYNAHLLHELKEADGWLEYLNPAALPDDQHRQAFDAYAWRIEDILCGENAAQSSAWLNKKHVEWLGKPVGKFIRHDYAGWQQLHRDFEQDYADGIALYTLPSDKE